MSLIRFIKKYQLRIKLFSLIGAMVFFFLFFIVNSLYPLKTDISYSKVILSDKGEIMSSFLSVDDKWRMKTELDEISPDFLKCILHKEDRFFYWHFGFNPFAISRAAFNNVIEGKKTSGASTITMQVVRLLDPKPRTYWSKFVEVFQAIKLEFLFSKDEILTMYCNLLPYGGNIEGIKAASELFLGTPCSKLSLAQAITLAIVPNRPSSLALGRFNDKIVEERNRWVTLFKKEKIFSKQSLEGANTEPLLAYRRASPKFAPHLSRLLHHSYSLKDIINTSISLSKQDKVRNLAFNYLKPFHLYGIHNAAVLVVDNKDRSVVTYVGSPDFFDNNHSGQVDGVLALRSPGSTLKPLVYGLNFDEGFYTPKMKILDTPSDFDTYSPLNFDNEFSGEVTLSEGLSRSLNIPAVRLLDNIGVPSFLNKLKLSGFKSIESQEHKLGLSVILGGCGVSLFELCGLYSAFANQGRFSPLHFIKGGSVQNATPVLTPSSTYMVSEILTTLNRPDFPEHYNRVKNLPKVAWKTGTSYGRRDAWSIGYNAQYTVGVWIGNFDGKSADQLVGGKVATPLMFEVFKAIQNTLEEEWLQSPDSLDFRLVCEESGLPPSDFCHNIITDYFIPLKSPIKKCNHLKAYFVSSDEKVSFCNFCLPSSNYKKKLYHNYDPALISYFENNNFPYVKIPAHNPYCEHVAKRSKPVIVSPLPGREYFINNTSTELVLKAITTADVSFIYWYINDRFLKRVDANSELFFTPPYGKVKISCSDDKGRNTDIFIEVQ